MFVFSFFFRRKDTDVDCVSCPHLRENSVGPVRVAFKFFFDFHLFLWRKCLLMQCIRKIETELFQKQSCCRKHYFYLNKFVSINFNFRGAGGTIAWVSVLFWKWVKLHGWKYYHIITVDCFMLCAYFWHVEEFIYFLLQLASEYNVQMFGQNT